jgi:NADH-quinone oxidoreductase subunit A
VDNALAGSVGIAAYLALFAGVGFVFIFVNLLVGRFLRPHNPHKEKLEIYECGEPAIGSSFVQFDLRFYVIALIFIVFDVEVAFLFPWATVFGKASHLAQASLDGDNATENITSLARELGGLDASQSLGDPEQIVAGASTLVGIAAIEMLVFFAILLVAYAYVWRVGALDWVRALSDQRPELDRPEPRLRVADQVSAGAVVSA